MFEKRLEEIYPHLTNITYDISAGPCTLVEFVDECPFPLNSSRHSLLGRPLCYL